MLYFRCLPRLSRHPRRRQTGSTRLHPLGYPSLAEAKEPCPLSCFGARRVLRGWLRPLFLPTHRVPPLAVLAIVEENTFANGRCVPGRRLNGDDSDEGSFPMLEVSHPSRTESAVNSTCQTSICCPYSCLSRGRPEPGFRFFSTPSRGRSASIHRVDRWPRAPRSR